ncbi:MAG: ABC transporter substrate-binding protein [Deinococcota bacterium]
MIKRLLILTALVLPFAFGQTLTDALGDEVNVSDTSRVISLGGDITEIIFALGQEEHLVARDSSSGYPTAVSTLPEVGYVRRLATEGVLSLEPSLIITSEDAGPPEVLTQIRQAGVPLFVVPTEESIEGAKAKISAIAQIFDAQAQADDLNRQIDLDVLEAQLYTDAARASDTPSVMFIYARGAGTLSVSGTDTSAHAMIELAGARNAVVEYEGYKPLTAEAAVAAAPDMLLFLESGLASVGGAEGLTELPGLALTPAYDSNQVLAMDGLYLLGFGPRVGQAIKALTLAMYPDVDVATAP